MSLNEIKSLPIGTTVETAMGNMYTVESLNNTHIVLKNTRPRPKMQRTGIGPQWREFEKLTIKQASRLLITD